MPAPSTPAPAPTTNIQAGSPLRLALGRLQLSGANYVSSRLREDGADAQRLPLPIRVPDGCDHAATICATRSCVDSWLIDWDLAFHRTGGGRALAAAVGIDLP